eukprot:g18391.t1
MVQARLRVTESLVRRRVTRQVNFVLSHSDIEWHDLKLPVLTFQRGKATRRVIRVPMRLAERRRRLSDLGSCQSKWCQKKASKNLNA